MTASNVRHGVKSCTVILKDYSLHQAFFTKYTLQFFEHMNVVSHDHAYPFSRKSTNTHPSTNQKIVPITLLVKCIVLDFPFSGDIMWCHSMHCHFVFGSKWQNQLASPITILNRKSQPSAACFWSNCDNASMHVFVFIHKQVGNPTGTNFPSSWSHHPLLYGMESYAKLQCNSLTITLRSPLMSASTFCLLHTIMMFLSQLQHGWLV